jgi:hypothetical protein
MCVPVLLSCVPLSRRESVDGHLVTPATVSEVLNMGWTVKYVLRFDDDVEVRRHEHRHEHGHEHGLAQHMYLMYGPWN